MPISISLSLKKAPLWVLAWFSMAVAHAAGMVPQTPVLVVEEGLGEAVMNVRNTDARPALLHTRIENVEQDDDVLLLVTPPVARVEPDGIQQVRFILQTVRPLQTERLKRVVFEGIAPTAAADGSQVSLGVRQNLPVIMRPAGLAIEREPWKRLHWSATADGLQVSNPSPYVVRLAKGIVPLPGSEQANLPRTYILPGERLNVGLPLSVSVRAMTVRIFPATTYGFAVERYDAPVTR
ncbi:MULTISPECIES: fimbria/pilus chaperone family protein [Pseudomonas]|uniref:P pilus assembly protein chaperone PapD n=1 Tax=Pseudomonas koreensis TaxID=198620 RepID=A0AA94JJB2_9PSED|nr:fimbria/pilus chaperone family protein [Pseudomonas koreensis]RVD79398.1 P pilus assembly protein chaperone PapD [Pseudomonas koreensis]